LKVEIQDEHGAFVILVDGKRFRFSDEERREKLVEVFKALGIEDVEYEEVY
jgi:predicted metal-dependent phosphoesterase TrpH